ncbi:MAG: hypothetical protein ABH950_08960 [Candidatus Altiarchaeota archaeon]
MEMRILILLAAFILLTTGCMDSGYNPMEDPKNQKCIEELRFERKTVEIRTSEGEDTRVFIEFRKGVTEDTTRQLVESYGFPFNPILFNDKVYVSLPVSDKTHVGWICEIKKNKSVERTGLQFPAKGYQRVEKELERKPKETVVISLHDTSGVHLSPHQSDEEKKTNLERMKVHFQQEMDSIVGSLDSSEFDLGEFLPYTIYGDITEGGLEKLRWDPRIRGIDLDRPLSTGDSS